MNLSDGYIQDRVIERGVLMVTIPGKEPQPSEGPSAPNPITDAIGAVIEEVVALVRPVILSNQLDHELDKLLFNDHLFDLLSQLPGALAERVEAVEDDELFPGLDALAGGFCAEKVKLLLHESGKALFDLWIHSRSRPPKVPAERHRFAGKTLLWPSLYTADRLIPPEIQRALLGRDIGQIILPGLVLANAWELSKVRVADLCERFITNQSLWLEFLNFLPGTHVSEDALPKDRIDFAEAASHSKKANEKMDLAVDYLDRTGEKFYRFFERESDDAADGGHK